MATVAGAVQNFENVHLVIDGFRVNGYADGGVGIAFQGARNAVTPGIDNLPVVTQTGNSNAIVTPNNLPNAEALDYMTTWIEAGDVRLLELRDSNGRSVYTCPIAIPEQQPDRVFNAVANPVAWAILCPITLGGAGGLNG